MQNTSNASTPTQIIPFTATVTNFSVVFNVGSRIVMRVVEKITTICPIIRTAVTARIRRHVVSPHDLYRGARVCPLLCTRVYGNTHKYLYRTELVVVR